MMNAMHSGWKLGGRIAMRLAVVYILLAALVFYLQVSSRGMAAVWRPERLVLAQMLGSGVLLVLATPLLLTAPILLAWLAGSVAGFMTGLLAPVLGNRSLARWWGMFCFSVPSIIFHNAADLRPTLILGQHWLNSYWFWIGLPTLISILVGAKVGERLAANETNEVVIG